MYPNTNTWMLIFVLRRKFSFSLQSHLNRAKEHKEGTNLNVPAEKGSLTALNLNLEKQLQAWKENPVWTKQPPEIKVRKS